jgi:hypothetical protein
MGVQLRHYPIKPGHLDEFLEKFPNILAVRETFGFRCLFAFADRERNDFIICIEGDLGEAESRYVASAELARVEEELGIRELFDAPRLANVDVVRAIWND